MSNLSNICVNIISYFGEGAVRAQRVAIHNKQLDWCISHGVRVFINAMDYEEHEYINHELVTYYRNSRMPISQARNFLLEKFYASDYDATFFMDNDSIIKDKYVGATRTFQFVSEQIEDLKNSLVYCFVPAFHLWMDNVFDDHNAKLGPGVIEFTVNRTLKTSLFVLLNTRKFVNKQFFMDENITFCEDNEFGFQLELAGLGVYECKSVILDEMEADSTSTGEKNSKVSEETMRMFRTAESYITKIIPKYSKMYPWMADITDDDFNMIQPIVQRTNEIALKHLPACVSSMETAKTKKVVDASVKSLKDSLAPTKEKVKEVIKEHVMAQTNYQYKKVRIQLKYFE